MKYQNGFFSFVFSLLLLLPVVSFAEIKVGFVKASELLEKAPQADDARGKLEREFAPREKRLVAAQQEIAKKEERLAKDRAVLSEPEMKKQEREIRDQKRDIGHQQDEFREDFNIRRNEELGILQKRIYEVIVALAKQENFDVIVGETAAIYASEKVDVTAKILQRLQQDYKSGGK